MKSVEKQREKIAGDFDPSIHFLLRWLEEHKTELEGEVHKPPMISVDVVDKSRAWQIEALTTIAVRSVSIALTDRKGDH